MDHGHMTVNTEPTAPMAPTFFSTESSHALTIVHILSSIVTVFILLPATTILFRSRRIHHTRKWNLISQLTCLCFTLLTTATGVIYSSKSPSGLYPHNSHVILGFIMIGVLLAWQIFMILPSVQRTMKLHQRQHQRYLSDSSTLTNFSDERSGESSSSSPLIESPLKHSFHSSNQPALTVHQLKCQTQSPSHSIQRICALLEPSILIFGFIVLLSGITVYLGILQGHDIFGGLAHFIKGGIFFVYGIFTLARWSGLYAKYGWAWNLKPSHDHALDITSHPKCCNNTDDTLNHNHGFFHSIKPSNVTAEFVESFLIFFYGATNVFLEHLGSWGRSWSHQDLEHLVITLMFLGGGLLGLLIELPTLRHLITPALRHSPSESRASTATLNPVPAIILFALGQTMSSHHQSSLLSTELHAYWGKLFLLAALSRIITYIIFFLRPVNSSVPCFPPSELVTSFTLTAGGLLFMQSTHSLVNFFQFYQIPSMLLISLNIGITALILSWSLLLFSARAWASRS